MQIAEWMWVALHGLGFLHKIVPFFAADLGRASLPHRLAGGFLLSVRSLDATL